MMWFLARKRGRGMIDDVIPCKKTRERFDRRYNFSQICNPVLYFNFISNFKYFQELSNSPWEWNLVDMLTLKTEQTICNLDESGGILNENQEKKEENSKWNKKIMSIIYFFKKWQSATSSQATNNWMTIILILFM